MEFIPKVFPGLGAFVAASLTFFFLVQFIIYLKTKDRVYYAVAMFCGLSAPIAYEQVLVQARMIHSEFCYYFICATLSLFILSFVYYAEAMRRWIPVPNSIYNLFRYGCFLLFLASLIPIGAYYFFGIAMLTDMEPVYITNTNYFIESYGQVIGTNLPALAYLQTALFLVTLIFSVSILNSARRIQADPFLIFGVIFTIMAIGYEAFAFTFNIFYFVPLIFLANYIEAARLTVLNIKKYLISRHKQLIEEVFT